MLNATQSSDCNCVLDIQHLSAIDPDVRANFDVLFIGKSEVQENKRHNLRSMPLRSLDSDSYMFIFEVFMGTVLLKWVFAESVTRP